MRAACGFSLLQWGRVVKDAEMHDQLRHANRYDASMGPRRERRGNTVDLRASPAALLASMGPRRERRGNFPLDSYGPGDIIRFNGAAS